MQMSDIRKNNMFDGQDWFQQQPEDELLQEQDMLMEQILENINTTPIGKVLKVIASLPEVRQKKVLNLRCQLKQGQYDLNDRLDLALDKVLEEIISS
jgi:hypothetical protein